MSRVSGTGRHLAVTARVVWAVLRNPALRRVELAYLLFSAALYGCYIAILVYAYEASGPGAVGVVALVLLLPAAVVAPFAASLADRYPRERVLLAGYVVQAVAYAITAAGMLSGVPPVFVYLAAAVQSAGTTLTRPAQGSLLPRLARTPEELTAANSVSGTIEGAGVLLGPLAATALLVVAGPGAVWALGALASTVAVVLVMNVGRLLDGRRVADRPAGAASSDHVVSGEDHEHTESVPSLVVGGLRALAASADTRLVVGLLAVRMVISGAMDVLFVLLAQEVFMTGQAGAGLLNAGLGLGTVLGGAASVALVGRRRMAPALRPRGRHVGGGDHAHRPRLAGQSRPGARRDRRHRVRGHRRRGTHDPAARHRRPDARPGAGRPRGHRADRARRRVGAGAPAGRDGWASRAPWASSDSCCRRWWWWPGCRLAASTAASGSPCARSGSSSSPPSSCRCRRPSSRPSRGGRAGSRWSPGRRLIREGEAGDRYYVLESGRLRVTIDGREVRILDQAGTGMGEIALLHNVRRTATLTAVTPCVLLALERSDFLEAVTGHEATHAVVRETAAGHTMGPPGRPGGGSA